MRRLAVTALILAAAAPVAGAAPGAPAWMPLGAKAKTAVRVKSCSIQDHSAIFYARMKKLRRTWRMRMRFTLLEREPGSSRFKRVRAPGLSRWHRSAAGVRAYGYSQEVRGLHDGAAYRMRVRYRWYDADNGLQRSSRRTSRACRMFVPLANLRVRVLGAQPQGYGVWRYSGRVVNSGEVAADDVPVRLAVDGHVVDTQTVSHLEPGESADRAFDGPSCTWRFTFRVDPGWTIPETDERDNGATALC